MELSEADKRWIRQPFPKDFPERLERFRELMGLSWRELAACVGVKYGRVMGWRRGAAPKGFALLALIRLARRVDGVMDVLFPDVAEALRRQDREG